MTRVLWFDDQYKDMQQFVTRAEIQGFELEGFESAEEGIKFLDNNFERIDLVLLDGLFYEKKIKGTVNEKGMGNVIAKINELKTKKNIPFFVLSGQDKFTKGDNSLLIANDIRSYDKKNPTQIEELFQDMKEKVKSLPDFLIKQKYHNVFKLCEDNYLGTKELNRALKIIKDIENPENINNQQDSLTPIRKILESIFKKLNSIGLIPDEIQNNTGNFNGASIFISAKNANYIYNEMLIDPVISECIRFLVVFSQDASHNEGNILNADSYLSDSSNTFLYRSLCFSTIEVLEYLKPFIDDNSDKETNQLKWSLKNEVLIGTIKQDNERNYHCDNYLLNYKLVEEKYKIGQKIKILEAVQNIKQRTKNYYPYYASRIVPI
jgi:hypothetical protein